MIFSPSESSKGLVEHRSPNSITHNCCPSALVNFSMGFQFIAVDTIFCDLILVTGGSRIICRQSVELTYYQDWLAVHKIFGRNLMTMPCDRCIYYPIRQIFFTLNYFWTSILALQPTLRDVLALHRLLDT